MGIEYCEEYKYWRKLWPNKEFTEGYSDEEEFEGSNNTHTQENQITEITNQLQNPSGENPLKNLIKHTLMRMQGQMLPSLQSTIKLHSPCLLLTSTKH